MRDIIYDNDFCIDDVIDRHKTVIYKHIETNAGLLKNIIDDGGFYVGALIIKQWTKCSRIGIILEIISVENTKFKNFRVFWS